MKSQLDLELLNSYDFDGEFKFSYFEKDIIVIYLDEVKIGYIDYTHDSGIVIFEEEAELHVHDLINLAGAIEKIIS